ncbi:MAG: S8 family peptidase [Candidatus Eremiobacteraeota bacterium]|nr:S8 family peptidase [Candidatus Eremiobacteraeota bacterium]
MNAIHMSQTLALQGQNPLDAARRAATAEGKIPVIVQADQEGMVEAQDTFTRLTGVTELEDLHLINGFAAEVTPEALNRLNESGQKLKVTVDEEVHLIDPVLPEESGPRPELDNAMATLGVDKLWEQGYRGQGVTIAVIDTGIYPHPDLQDRIVAFKDWVAGRTEAYDDQGHGTHVAGDAGGNGTMSDGRYMGAAPEANLVGIKVLDKHGSGRLSDIIKGVQWAVDHKDEHHIDIINMSLGGPVFASYKEDPVAQAVGEAINHGIIAAVAGGNSGPKPSTIGTPGNHPQAFTVGALDDHGTRTRADDDVAFFSSRGPTSIDGLTKPDILSPGVAITAANSPGSALDKLAVPHVGRSYITISGTSMATPVMAGVIAAVLSANHDLTPAEVKEIFTSTATPLEGVDANSQGSGVVNAEGALAEALKRKQS